jgi:hypothetical protein
MLLFSPAWLFLVPGAAAVGTGLLLTCLVAFARVEILGHRLQTHFALLGSAVALVGLQVALLGVFAKTVFVLDGIGKSPGVERLIAGFRLEMAIALGALAFVVGACVDARILIHWLRSAGGELKPGFTNLAIFGGTLIGLGVEIIFSSFFLSILKSSRTKRWV